MRTPTSALDLETERIVQSNLDELRKGKTTIIIAHRLSTIQNSDIIYVMHEGKIVEQGTHQQLMEMDSYYRKLAAKEKETDIAESSASEPLPLSQIL